MRRPLLLALLAAVACTGMQAVPAHADTANFIDLGMGGGQFMKHCRADIYIAEYERVLGPKISVLGRVSGVSYKFDDGTYQERGRPRGLDVGMRYYPSGGMEGFFAGGSVGYWTADWRFTKDEGTAIEAKGDARSDSVRVNFDLGARIPLGSSAVSIVPALNVGRYFSSRSCEYTAPLSRVGTPCSQDSEVKYYIFWAVMAGIAF